MIKLLEKSTVNSYEVNVINHYFYGFNETRSSLNNAIRNYLVNNSFNSMYSTISDKDEIILSMQEKISLFNIDRLYLSNNEDLIFIEIAGNKKNQIMEQVEKLMHQILSQYKIALNNNRNFRIITVAEALSGYGKNYESILSKHMTEPYWLVDYPLLERDFYEKQNHNDYSTVKNFKLFIPGINKSFVSGSELEYEYDQITRRINLRGIDVTNYKNYLYYAKEGFLRAATGCLINLNTFTDFIENY